MRLLTTLLFLSLAFSTFAQDNIKDEAQIKFKVSDFKADGENGGMMAMAMNNATMDFAITKEKTMNLMSMMGGMISQGTVMDNDRGETTRLLSTMGNNVYSKQKTDRTGESRFKQEMNDLELVYDKKTKKKIAGYNCHKVTTKTKDGTMTFYVTEKIDLKGIPMMDSFQNLKGFPLEMTIQNKMFNMTMTAQSVSGKVNESAFSVPEGYKEITADEMNKMLSRFGGGLGF